MGLHEVWVGGRGFELVEREQTRLNHPPHGSLTLRELVLRVRVYAAAGWSGASLTLASLTLASLAKKSG